MVLFSDRLKALGFDSYAAYLGSDHWRAFRVRYRKSGRPTACAVCGAKPSQLHHTTYDNLGGESLDDVIPLCQGHHKKVHRWLDAQRKGVADTHLAVEELKRTKRKKKKKRKRRRRPAPRPERPPRWVSFDEPKPIPLASEPPGPRPSLEEWKRELAERTAAFRLPVGDPPARLDAEAPV